MRARILSAMTARGCFVREDNGNLIRVSYAWASPLVREMSRSSCHYALLGIAGRKDHGVILSRRLVTALQSFRDRHGQDEPRETEPQQDSASC
jgi:hypothetical protein